MADQTIVYTKDAPFRESNSSILMSTTTP
jgi:hypothetical protein